MPPTLAGGQILFQIVFSVWITLSEHKWVSLGLFRDFDATGIKQVIAEMF